MGALDAEAKQYLGKKQEGDVDMCLAQENRNQRMKILGAIEIYREYGATDEDIIQKVINKFNVTREVVLSLLTSKTV